MTSLWQRWNPVSTVYGKDGEYLTAYQTRIKLMPRTPWGYLRLHIFWRGDADPDPHDHPCDFWTFPFRTYVEMVLRDGKLVPNFVQAWRIHKRPAEYTHLVVGPVYKHPYRAKQSRTVVTLCWFGPKKRPWGFWVRALNRGETEWTFSPWREYIFKGRTNRV